MLYASEVGQIIGISRTRVELLAQEGRIVVPRKVWGKWRMIPIEKEGQAWQIPENFRVLRGNQSRPGPVTDFIERWEANHEEIIEQERQENLAEYNRCKQEQRRQSVAERIKRNAPHGSKTSFFAPQI